MTGAGQPPPFGLQLDRLLAGAEPEEDLVAAGADLEVDTLLAAYRRGLFPMGLGEHGGPPLGWWSPDPRGVLPLDGLRVSRSLRRSMRRFELRVDTAFDRVLSACADPSRDGRWISNDVAHAYRALHQAGHAHSVETWCDGELVGGLYGVSTSGLFAGESMFHHTSDASKVALVSLANVLRDEHVARRLIDVQWRTPHLASLGAEEVSRADYLSRLPALLDVPLPAAFDRKPAAGG